MIQKQENKHTESIAGIVLSYLSSSVSVTEAVFFSTAHFSAAHFSWLCETQHCKIVANWVTGEPSIRPPIILLLEEMQLDETGAK